MTTADVTPRGQRPSLRQLGPHLRPHLRVLVGALLLGLVAAAAGLVQPLAARDVLGRLEDGTGTGGALVWLGVLVVAGAAATASQFYLLDRTAERVVRRVRGRLAAHLLAIRMPVLDRLDHGDLVTRVTSDATLLGTVTTSAFVSLATGTVSLIGALVLMAVVSPILLAVTMAVLVVTGGAIAAAMPPIRRAHLHQQEAVGQLGGALSRLLAAIRTVRASGAEERELRTASTALEEAYSGGVKVARFSAIVNTATVLSVNVAFLAVLGTGGALVAADRMDVPDLIAFLLYLFYLVGPVSELTEGAAALQGGVAALARIEGTLELPVEADARRAHRSAGPPVSAAGRDAVVTFDDVSFSYDDGTPVLRGVSFDVPARGLTALIGHSGAGKTTIFSLLERFYDPDGGTITLNGRPIDVLARDAVRARLAYVEQDAPVLRGTLRENLLLAAPDVEPRLVDDVLAATNLDQLVSRLPDGLDTVVGTGGSTLSGGQRQRMAIARALLRRPDVLLLDEATSQLDAATEADLRATVERSSRDHAVVAIAHRLSTVVDADQIILLDAGRVRGVGTHAELLEADDLYRDLVALQLGST